MIAAYLDGRVAGPERAAIEAHLAACEDCYILFSESARFELEERGEAKVLRPRFGRGWIALAVAACLVAAAVPLWLVRLRARHRVRYDVAELVAAVGPVRPFEPRLTGGFEFGPMAPRYRSAKPLSESDSWEVLAAAAKIRKRDEQKSTPETLDALGAANLVLGKWDDAVSNLEEATLEAPKNARFLTDLSAAYLVRAKEKDRADDYPKALESAEKATEIDPSILEAWFNRALALDELPLKSEAAKAWHDYLKLDSKSGWADEARKRLAAIEAIPNHAEEWKKAKAKLLAAAKAGDSNTLRAIIGSWRQETRTLLEEELLPGWADAELAGEKAKADEAFTSARRIADAHSEASNDPMMKETVGAMALVRGSGDDRAISRLAIGFTKYREGKGLYGAAKFSPAFDSFTASGECLRSFGVPLAYSAEIYRGIRLYYAGKISDSRDDIEALIRRDRGTAYLEYLGRLFWMKGLTEAVESDLALARRDYLTAAADFETSGQHEEAANAHVLLADCLGFLGQAPETWREYRFALRSEPEIEQPRLRYVLFTVGILDLERRGLFRGAIHFGTAALESAETWRDSNSVGEANLYIADCEHSLGMDFRAERELEAARAAVRQIPDADVAARFQAQVWKTEGRILERSRPELAEQSLTKALDYERRTTLLAWAPADHLARGRVRLRLGRLEPAENDFLAGIRDFERNRAEQGDYRIPYFDRSWDLFDEMIRMLVDRRGDPEGALQYVERDRARSLLDSLNRPGDARDSSEPMTIVAIRRKIPDHASLVYYQVLEDRLLAWVVTPKGVSFRQEFIPSDELGRRVAKYRSAMVRRGHSAIDECSALYDLLVLPVESLVPGGSGIVFVPDGPLCGVSFAALIDRRTGKFLVEDHPVSVAPSGTSFVRSRERLLEKKQNSNLTALVIGDPEPGSEGVRSLRPLPGAKSEAGRIAGMYPNSTLLTGADATKENFLDRLGGADVVHFAGHAIADAEYPAFSRLAFAPGPNASGSVDLTALEIARSGSVRTRLAVLSACGSGEGAYVRGEGVMSLARPFLAAGVPDVVATLWNIDDEAAVAVGERFHAWIRRGEEPALALRRSQIELARGGNDALRAPFAWGAFEVFGGVR